MPTIDNQGRPEPEPNGDEITTLLTFLDFQRATLKWKCEGVDREGLSMKVAASTMSLGGLLKHMAVVEDFWFSRALHAHERADPWRMIDWKSEPDWEWTSSHDDEPEYLWALWQESVERSRGLVSQALQDGDLDQDARLAFPEGPPSLRWILVHMIEEYARHNGHADLIREAIDGSTGE
jgi:uncharacterized damage-inducible protein DinB